ncbi:TIM barrel protein [Silvibacterium dinghuense]|uniref:Sugar isomerase n=1 Tax=Silvibacterium dinghuense TaxID=1560006 RepID=A0A4Q1SL73_9BACT|nr:TIM barrel protein [Silvibacterium dinghuense]RXS98207.1 sugar isomerase [Silvibacterium dinghuense]GGH00813.1 L-rhamnose isomerase [Silvibacterium dinghuense]
MGTEEQNLPAKDARHSRVFAALDRFRIEIPSWGFANTGTRFGKFLQPAAATSLEEKFADAGEVNRLTGCTPTVALHVLWDLPQGESDVARVRALEAEHGVRAGSINPNLFQEQEYKFGSIANPAPAVRKKAIGHLLESAAIAKALKVRDVSLWVPDGSNYPGTQSVRRRIAWMEEALLATCEALEETQRLLIEYKPFEPAFYHTDIADWGMALHLARVCGPKAKVLVDTGHHAQATNIEQIVAWLLHTGSLGGFHFNDRKYADDDLTLGSIDPYQLFRIFQEMMSAGENADADVAYMIDQSHNMKGKVEAMVQSVVTAQELYARAALIDQKELAKLQDACRLVEAEELFRDAFWTDVRPLVRAWRTARGLAEDPLSALRGGGYVERRAEERRERNSGGSSAYA